MLNVRLNCASSSSKCTSIVVESTYRYNPGCRLSMPVSRFGNPAVIQRGRTVMSLISSIVKARVEFHAGSLIHDSLLLVLTDDWLSHPVPKLTSPCTNLYSNSLPLGARSKEDFDRINSISIFISHGKGFFPGKRRDTSPDANIGFLATQRSHIH